MSVKLAKMDALQRPNLLVNADFRSGVINQKGQSRYNAIYQYGIDMWYMISNGTLTVNSNSISNQSDLKQFFKNKPDNGDYTFAVSIGGMVYTTTLLGFTGTSKMANINVSGKTLGIEMLNNFLVLYMNGQTFNIEFIKLEEGDCFTGMPVWNKQTELIKCQERYISLRNTNAYIMLSNVVATATNKARITINIPTFLISRGPTVYIQNIFVVQTNDGGWRQINRIISINYLVNYIILDVELVPDARPLSITAEQYLLINTNGYINIDFNDY